MAQQKSILSPKYLPSLKWSSWSSWYGAISFKNITHSNHSNSQNWLRWEVSPYITVLGASPSSWYIRWAVLDQMHHSNSKQLSQSLLGSFDLIIFLTQPFSFCYISPWGDWFSFLKVAWSLVELSVELNLDHILWWSHVIADSTLSCWKSRDNASLALLFNVIGNKCDKIGSKYPCTLIAFQHMVLANNVSLYNSCGNHLYLNWWLLLLNCCDKDGFTTVQTPCHVVCQIVFRAFSSENRISLLELSSASTSWYSLT